MEASHSRYQRQVRPQWARIVQEKNLPFRPHKPTSQSARRGLKHEERAHKHFIELYGLSYFHSIWFAYGDSGQVRYCQIDGLLADAKRKSLVLVECKLTHTPEAYWQTEYLYVPVLRAWLTDAGRAFWQISVCEVVRWFDPHTAFPTHPTLVEGLEYVRPDRFNVHIL
jgi:hypothetical protein